MKYEYYPKRRTEQERRELNEQILRLLQSEACEQAGVTDEDIFNRYISKPKMSMPAIGRPVIPRGTTRNMRMRSGSAKRPSGHLTN